MLQTSRRRTFKTKHHLHLNLFLHSLYLRGILSSSSVRPSNIKFGKSCAGRQVRGELLSVEWAIWLLQVLTAWLLFRGWPTERIKTIMLLSLPQMPYRLKYEMAVFFSPERLLVYDQWSPSSNICEPQMLQMGWLQSYFLVLGLHSSVPSVDFPIV